MVIRKVREGRHAQEWWKMKDGRTGNQEGRQEGDE
jgi:hypothetical protein